jgi:DNA-binding NarL/FixJ family response regulator
VAAGVKDSRLRGEQLTSANRNELSKREIEIVRQLAEGNSNKEIAACKNLSIMTVESYSARIMLKLDIRALTHLIRYAVQNKLVVF